MPLFIKLINSRLIIHIYTRSFINLLISEIISTHFGGHRARLKPSFEPDLIDLKMMRTKGSLCAKLRFHLIDNKWRFYYAHCVLPSPHSDNDLIWHTFGLDQSLATLYGPDHLVSSMKGHNAGILTIPLGDALGVSLHLSVLHHQNDLHDHFYILGLENWASSTIHNPMTKLRELAKTLGGWFCSVHEKKRVALADRHCLLGSEADSEEA